MFSKPPAQQHPISYLVKTAQHEFEEVKQRQSTSLVQAVKEYRKRYGMPPPPNFDKWYEFATENKLLLVDEFDNLHQSITPFWGLAPHTVRSRAANAFRSGKDLMRVVIEQGNITAVEGGPDWQREAIRGMIEKFVRHLPSMELVFNVLDEPRVVVPHADLERLVAIALTENIPFSGANRSPVNSFSPQLPDWKFQSGSYMADAKFAQIAHQPSWPHLRLSCGLESPAKSLAEGDHEDDVARYGLGALGFIYNTSAMSDVCLTPSLGTSHGFFDAPASHSISYDLLPVFSQSATSSNSDILYPSPWYWHEVVKYDASADLPWAEKENKLYWRGSTTGGFSSDGNWKRHHRQRFVDMMNAHDSALTLSRSGEKGSEWEVVPVSRDDYHDLIDVSFTRVIQCEQADCDSQAAHFNITERASQDDGWSSKYLLDMDGNAFSGRFYAFLRSASLTLKFAVFREWHGEWVKPWVHYIPLSLQAKEWLEVIRYFSEETEADEQARDIAAKSSELANTSLRKEDMEAWFFRLLLEYGRVIDDQRAYIGFETPSAQSPLIAHT